MSEVIKLVCDVCGATTEFNPETSMTKDSNWLKVEAFLISVSEPDDPDFEHLCGGCTEVVRKALRTRMRE